MPANLPPTYHEAEQRYRKASTPQDKIAALEEMLRIMPKHKGTDKLQADLKARIAKLRKQSSTRTARQSFSYNIPREGAGQIALLGAPNSGRSSLLATGTGASPEVAPYPFTTREPTPGMLPFEDIAFQLIDLPPINPEYMEHWVFDFIRRADFCWLVLNSDELLTGYETVLEELEKRKIVPCPADAPPPTFEDPGWLARPSLMVVTGADRPDMAENLAIFQELIDRRWPAVAVSTTEGTGFEELGRATFEAMGIIRIYTRQPGKPPDMDAPFTVPRGTTVGGLAYRIHKEVSQKMKSARIWGSGVFEGQTVHRSHVLEDGDVVEIRL